MNHSTTSPVTGKDHDPAITFQPGEEVQHVRTGKVYHVQLTPEVHSLRYEPTGEPCYAYTDGETCWVRPKSQMEDGRFVRVTR